MSSAICFNLDQSKILSSGNELITFESADIKVVTSFTVYGASFSGVLAVTLMTSYVRTSNIS